MILAEPFLPWGQGANGVRVPERAALLDFIKFRKTRY